jgi:hypothetical protein
MSQDKEYSPIEVCQVIGKALSKRIADFESEIASLRARELRKTEVGICLICGNPDSPEYCSCLVKSDEMGAVPGADAQPGGMAMKELDPGKKLNSGKSVVRSTCKGCHKLVNLDLHKCSVNKGETFIDKKNDSESGNGGSQGDRLKDIGHATPRIPKPKRVTPARHAEGGNDGSAVRQGGKMFPAANGKSSDSDPVPEGDEKQILKENPGKPGGKSSGTGKSGAAAGGALMANKAEVPMAKPPSGGTGLSPKPPPMSKGDRTHNSTGSAFPTSRNSTGSVQPNLADSEESPIKKAALPGTPQGDALQAAHQAPKPAAPAAKPAIKIPGRAQQYADFMPAGQFSAAGAGVPPGQGVSSRMYQGTPAVKKITLPGKGGGMAKPAAVPTPASAPFHAPPASVRPPAPAPGAKPAAPAPAAQTSASAPAPKPAAPTLGKKES